MKDIFDLTNIDTELPKMNQNDFIEKAKKILVLIDNAYGNSWYNRSIKDEEYEVAPCNGCKGGGCFKTQDKEVQCFADQIEGDCYERCFDHEAYSEEMEDILFGEKSDFYELISAEIIKPTE